jgi:hypothetical protein
MGSFDGFGGWVKIALIIFVLMLLIGAYLFTKTVDAAGQSGVAPLLLFA